MMMPTTLYILRNRKTFFKKKVNSGEILKFVPEIVLEDYEVSVKSFYFGPTKIPTQFQNALQTFDTIFIIPPKHFWNEWFKVWEYISNFQYCK